MKTVTRFRLLAAMTCLALCVGWLNSSAGKGKPGGGGGGGGAGQNGGGVIYFSYDNELFTMNDDGSGVALVAGFPDGYDPWGEPSRGRHADKRWLAQMSFVPGGGTVYPNGQPRDEFVALSDGGDVVRLAISADLNPLEQPRWVIGDGYLSWVGRRWDDDPLSPTYGDVLEGGLYVTELAFDGQGNITGIASPSELLVPFALIDGVDPDILNHGWSPDGTRFVFVDLARRELVIADLLTETFDVLISGKPVWSPRWSPAGDKLLIRYNDTKQRAGVWTMNLDGSGLTMLEGYRTKSQPFVGVWSPTGSHLLYEHHDHTHVDSYIVRAKANGKGKGRTQITDKSMGSGFWPPSPLGWRD